jgi:hypothetical protein
MRMITPASKMRARLSNKGLNRPPVPNAGFQRGAARQMVQRYGLAPSHVGFVSSPIAQAMGE